MLSGERRGASVRRGMTVLGRIPAVPKPINLPSQRLENRGLDPNVEIVPRGGVSWGSAGRSPPTTSNAWGAGTQASSPPLANGTLGNAQKQASGVSSSGAAWGGTAQSRPSSAGSGTRPSSAGSVGQMHESQTAANAWGPPPLPSTRPSSASATSRVTSGSVVQGQSQGPIHGQPSARPRFDERPRSAEARPAQASRLGESPNFASASAWGGPGADSKTTRESHHPTSFQLTRVDFPTLGSEKSPDLRPQQGAANMERGTEEKVFSGHQRPPPNLSGHFEEMPRPTVVAFGAPERPVMDSWHRDPSFGPSPGAEGNWHREDHRHMASHDGHPPVVDSWRRESGHDVSPGASPSDESWRRGGPLHGPGRFAHDPSGFPPQQRYGPGPVPGPYGRGGPISYGHHVGDVYGNPGLLARQGPLAGRPGPPLGPGIYAGPGPVPYDGSYAGPPMEDRGMMMMGMGMNGPGVYAGYQNQQGPPPDVFNRYSHGTIGSGPRVPVNSSRGMREHADLSGPEVDHQEGGSYKDGRTGVIQDSMSNRRLGVGPFESMRPGSQGASMGQHHGLRDWGASASEEPMDFSKPVFEEDGAPGQKSSDKPSGVVSNVGNHMERENKSNDADRDISRADDVKPRERHDDHKEVGKFSGRPGRKSAAYTWHVGESTQEGSRMHNRPKEGGALESEGEIMKKENRKVTNSTEKGSFDASRKDASSTSAGKDRSGSKDTALVAHRTHVVKHEDGAPVAAPVAGGAVRPSQQTVVGRPSGSGHAPPGAALGAEKMQAPDVESSVTSRVVPPADATTVVAEEKTKAIKLPNSGLRNGADSELGSNNDAVAPNAGKDHPIKEESVHKGKVAHDAEKEWRPKAANAESKVDVTSGISTQTAKGSAGSVVTPALAPEAPIAGAEKLEAESDPSTAEAYDYKAQRAKMKEIAHQRSLQLQKEEEERIKEQKAKAFAKLEELNGRSKASAKLEELSRRATGASDSSTVEELSNVAEGDGKRDTDTSGVMAPDVVTSNDTGRNISTLGGRNGKNEHGKRERGDRKGRAEKYQGGPGDLGSRELTKLRVSTSVNHVRTEPLLPSPSEPSAPVQSQPLSGGSLRGSSQDVRPLPNRVAFQPAQVGLKPQNARQRGKQLVMHHKQLGKQNDAGEETNDLSESLPERNESGVWSTAAVSGDLQTTDSNCVSANSTSTRKKRNSRNLKSKQKTEGSDCPTQVVVSSEHSDAGESLDNAKTSSLDLVSVESRSESVKDLRFQAGGIEFGDIDLTKDVLGIQSVSPRSNGDSRRPQRKLQASKRPRERGAQDVRIGDKAHMTEGLIWAPVRSPVNTSATGSKVLAEEGGSWTGSTEKSCASGATVSMSGKHTEVISSESGVKSQKDTPLQVPGHQNAPQKHLHQQGSEGSPRVFTGGAQQQGHVQADHRIESESKQADGKNLRAHASWRQRGSGNERGSSAKSYPAYQTSSKDGTSGNLHPDSRGTAGKGNSHVMRHEESSARGQGDSGITVQVPDQAMSHPRTQGQVTEQHLVQRPILSEQQAKHAPSHPKFDARVVKEDQHVAVQHEEMNRGSRFSQQVPVSSDKDQESAGMLAPQPGTNGSEPQTEHGRLQTEHGKPYHRGGGSHGERRPSERQPQRSSGNQGIRAPTMPDNSVRVTHHQGRPSASHVTKNRVYPSVPEAEKSVHVDQVTHGDQGARERERTTRERDQQHAKVHPSTHKSVGQGQQLYMHGGNDTASGQNMQVGRLQQGPLPSHEREHSGHGPQQQFRPVPNSRQQGPLHEKDQPRDAFQHQRPASGQTQWQQTSHKSQPQLSESRSGHHGVASGQKNLNSSIDLEQQMDAVKAHKQPLQMANDHQSSHSYSQGAGHQKSAQERRHSQSTSGPHKLHSAESNSNWAGDSGGGPFSRGRDQGHSRRGRVVARGGITGGGKPGVEVETKPEQVGPKRMVIDATGGAVPNLVAG